MANNRTANSYYIDTAYVSSVATTTELQIPNLKVKAVIVTATGGAGQAVLSDGGTSRLDLRVPTASTSVLFSFADSPIVFNTSIRPSTLTNSTVMVVFEEARK